MNVIKNLAANDIITTTIVSLIVIVFIVAIVIWIRMLFKSKTDESFFKKLIVGVLIGYVLLVVAIILFPSILI